MTDERMPGVYRSKPRVPSPKPRDSGEAEALCQNRHVPSHRKPRPDPKAETAPLRAPRLACFYTPGISAPLQKSADAGDAEAQFELGRLYFEGRADESHIINDGSDGKDVVARFTPGLPQSHAEAATLLQKAAEQGHTGARQLPEVVKLHIPKGVH